ncbi:cAMP-activated global transcriptional regulator CRP [Dyella japonica]|uniref:CRP-like protein Clp n=1 Tax=Dyella japonica TaxID=231455 RepID=A0ABV2K134_9GAMM
MQLKYQLQKAFELSKAPVHFAPDPIMMDRFLSLCQRRRYPSKTVIVRPADAANRLYYVVDGSLAVCTEDEKGNELILAYVSRGQFIGEMGLFVEHTQCESIVRTRTACEMAEISYERLFQLMEGPLREECPKLLFALGSQLANRLLRTSRQAHRIVFMDVTNRICRTLLDLCHEPDAMTHPAGTQIRVSRQEVSRIVGCSREMVGRVIKQLREHGMIDVMGKNIVVHGTRQSCAPTSPGNHLSWLPMLDQHCSL